MTPIVCTLFEGNYHYGVAALINSLYFQGYRGPVFAGYKGELPKWASQAVDSKWDGTVKTLKPAAGIEVHFVHLATDYHLTNYKPDFILRICEEFEKETDGIFYFDPDIVLVAPWQFMKDWMIAGVALSEDVNSPLEEHHPRRSFWRRYFDKEGIKLQFKTSVYVNGGFIGVARQHFNFIETWKHVQEKMAASIGGLSRSAFNGMNKDQENPYAPFSRTDQDALNATIEASDEQVSLIGQEAMAFKQGTWVIPHALGSPKPWNISYTKQIIKGKRSRIVDSKYWEFANGIIKSQPPHKIRLKKTIIKSSAIIGRFYRAGSI